MPLRLGHAITPVYQPGSTPDFDRLYRDTYPRLKRTLAILLGDPDAAERCVQAAFQVTFRAWPEAPAEISAEAWLHLHALRFARRHQRRVSAYGIGWSLARVGQPRRDIPLADEIGWPELGRALRTLPAQLAAAVVLRHYHDYSDQEIAATTGIGESAVERRLSEARRRLQNEVGVAFAAADVPAPPRTMTPAQFQTALEHKLSQGLAWVPVPATAPSRAGYRRLRSHRAWTHRITVGAATFAFAMLSGVVAASAAGGPAGSWPERAEGALHRLLPALPSSEPAALHSVAAGKGGIAESVAPGHNSGPAARPSAASGQGQSGSVQSETQSSVGASVGAAGGSQKETDGPAASAGQQSSGNATAGAQPAAVATDGQNQSGGAASGPSSGPVVTVTDPSSDSNSGS